MKSTCHAIGQSQSPQKCVFSHVSLPTSSPSCADNLSSGPADTYTGSCTESHLESQGTQPYESSFLGTSSEHDHPRSSSTFQSPTPGSTELSSNGESNLSLESEEVMIGQQFENVPRKAKLKAYQGMRTCLSTTPSDRSPKITFKPSALKKWFGPSGDRRVLANHTPLGSKQVSTPIQKTHVPNTGTDTEDSDMSLSMSSEDLSPFLISYDGSTNTPASSKSKDQASLYKLLRSG